MRRIVFAVLPLFLFGLAAIAAAFPGRLGAFVVAPAAAERAPAPRIAPSRVAAFNMVAIMKHYKKAKYQVWELAEEKKRLTHDVGEMKSEHQKLQQDVQTEADRGKKEKLQERMVELARNIEDRTHRIDKKLNDKAKAVIADLYDEIKEVVDALAEANGCDIVFAYPDAATPEEVNSPYMKELKLKPPAAYPFFLANRCDFTEQIIKELNERNPAPEIPAPDAPAHGKD